MPRDVHGRYHDLKAVADSCPAWASGCDKCKCGIVSAPDIVGAGSLYLERLVQAIDGDITFCDCQAGQRYRVSLLNRRQALIEEARKDSRMERAAHSLTHPDIENTRSAMQAKRVPTVHFDKAVTE